jgi:hypothetical protein
MSTSTSDPTKGLEAWEAQRKAWTTPNQQYLDTLETRQANNKYDDLIQNETQRKYIYKKIVHQRQNPLNPISLKYIVSYLKQKKKDSLLMLLI